MSGGVGGSTRTPPPTRPRVPTTWRCGVPRGLRSTSTSQRSRVGVEAEMLVLQGIKMKEITTKNKTTKKEDEAGPSTVIPIESSSEEDWADFSEEEEEVCDDPEKEELWEQFRSSDDEE
ncbi:hypothetical protein D1007_34936 [Hordeum vulgare]|nr:hypothetical protein D1007_34936 [Hordeum vulgare]